jgi:hypothetical protein
MKYFRRGREDYLPYGNSCWLPTAAARVRAHVWSFGICGGQSGAGAGFLRVLQFPLPIFIPPIAPQSPSSIIWGLYNKPEVAAVPRDLVPPHKKKTGEANLCFYWRSLMARYRIYNETTLIPPLFCTLHAFYWLYFATQLDHNFYFCWKESAMPIQALKWN